MLKCITFDGDTSTLNTLMGYFEKLDKALADVHQALSKEQTERPIFVREKTAPAGRCPFGERRRQAAARGEVRAALHDPLFHALVERAVLQETRPVLCRGYGFQGRNRALDVAHEPYAAALGRLRGKDVLVQIHLSAGSCQQHFQIHAAVRDRRPRRLGARCAGRCERVGLDDRRRMSCRLYRRDRQDAQLHQRLNNYFGGRQYREVFEENQALINELKKILSR